MDADVGVIGVGTMGSMVMWQLARRDVSAIGFEQFGIGHDRSAAGGESRAFRTAYLEGSEYIPLLQDSYNLWRELEKDSGYQLLTLNGSLMIGDPNEASMKELIKGIRKYNLDHEIFEGEKARKRFPQHSLSESEIIISDKMAGFIRAELAVVAAARSAEELGSTIYRNSSVERIQTSTEGVKIRANGTDYTVGKVIITTGPWTMALLPCFKEHFTVNKLVLTWFPSSDIKQFEPERFPVFIRMADDTKLFGLPTLDGSMVKVAPITGIGDGKVEDPDSFDRNVMVKETEMITNKVRKYLPDLIPEPTRVNVYMDSFTSDGHAIVGKVPGMNNMFVMSGFSGHGFKLAPIMGKIGTDLIIDGKTDHPIDHLDPLRFS